MTTIGITAEVLNVEFHLQAMSKVDDLVRNIVIMIRGVVYSAIFNLLLHTHTRQIQPRPQTTTVRKVQDQTTECERRPDEKRPRNRTAYPICLLYELEAVRYDTEQVFESPIPPTPV
ncbi:hypothetical protein WG66_003915 [Moniliophthora roreri]|nr:hypothetical protein WG66_003915 [Moniliophthora roreri]